MTSVSKNVYINNLAEMINKYNNSYHSTIKMKPVDVKSDSYNGFGKKIMINTLNLKFCYHVRISKHKNIFGKGYVPN